MQITEQRSDNGPPPTPGHYGRPRSVPSRRAQALITEAELEEYRELKAAQVAREREGMNVNDEMITEARNLMRMSDPTAKAQGIRLLSILIGSGDPLQESGTLAGLARKALPPPLLGDGDHDKVAQSVPTVPANEEKA